MKNKAAILTIDDELIILESLKIQLEKHFDDKYHLEFSDSVADAKEVINQLVSYEIKILLIISDWLMPGERGDELADFIKNNYPHIKIIMLTGQIDEKVAEKLISEDKVNKILPKPWIENELIDTINSLL